MSTRLRYKGRFIKEKVLKKKEKYKIGIEKQRQESRNLAFGEERKSLVQESPCSIINLSITRSNMKCDKCSKSLSLDNVIEEKTKGLHSIWLVKCEECNTLKHVNTGGYHKVNTEANRYLHDETHNDMTTNAVLGTFHAGIGHTELNKILSCLDLPTISPKLFKKYEQEVGPLIENLCKSSCDKAAREERQLVLEKVEELKRELPEEIITDFFNEINADFNNSTSLFDKEVGKVVNIIISYDMGWSKRGNGRSYDSLNGYGAIIGFLTKKILDYRTRNKKCRLCDLGRPQESHDCRRNCYSSSKAMEADVGTELVLKSNILKQNGLKVKVINGDEDSSLMASINRVDNDCKIYKLADSNHVKKNLSKKLYNLKNKYKELGRKGLITHLKKCFTYALSQNKGNSKQLKAAVQCIPDHMYNQYQNCGTWCKSAHNKLHKQKFVLKNEDLYKELTNLFSIYAKNAFKYCVNSSSQANEAFNNSVCHKFPKNKSYSTSPSGDIRVATAVLTTNEGNHFLPDLKERAGLQVCNRSLNYYNKLDRYKKNKSIKSKSVDQKRRRFDLFQNRDKLRKTLETSEGNTYKTNMAFEPCEEKEMDCVNLLKDITCLSNDNCRLVVFDLETSGRDNNSDILKIAAIVEDKIFSVYIEPNQIIDKSATEVNGLESFHGELYLRGKKVETMSIQDALHAFHSFLNRFAPKCILIAHNASFDIRYLVKELKRHCLIKDFSNIIYGFCDTLKLFRQKYPDRNKKGMCTLFALANDLLSVDVKDENFHEAVCDVTILQKLVDEQLLFDNILKNTTTYTDTIKTFLQNKQTSQKIKDLLPLKGELTNYIIRKIALSGTSYEHLKNIYLNEGENALLNYLSEIKDKKARVTKDKKILQKIINHFFNLTEK